MSTFKSQKSTRTIDIRPARNGRGVVICWAGGSINLDPADAPAIALAVLEAAGVEPRDHESVGSSSPEALEHIAMVLGDYIRTAEAKATAAAEEAEVEQEGFELWRTFSVRAGTQLHTRWGDLYDDDRAAWIAAARRAREIAEERNK